jgi:hypothetical protein
MPLVDLRNGRWDSNFFIDDFIEKPFNFKCQNSNVKRNSNAKCQELILDDLGKSPKRVLSLIPAERESSLLG